MHKKITKIKIKKLYDEDPMLDFLGFFSDDPGKFAVEHTDGSGRGYKYFNADNVENMTQARQNYKRMMEFNNGQVSMLGIKAEAEIQTSTDGKTWLINRLHSGGLWGMESDSDSSEFDNEGENQLAELSEVLQALGFTDAEIKAVEVEKESL